MPVRIRLALHGCTNRPFYHIVVAPSKAPRNGRHLEQVGSYDPMPNYNGELLVGLNLDRIKYWMGAGAQPTVAVYKLLSLAGVMPIHPRLLLEASRKREIAEEALKKNTQQTAIEAESSSNPTTENMREDEV